MGIVSGMIIMMISSQWDGGGDGVAADEVDGDGDGGYDGDGDGDGMF